MVVGGGGGACDQLPAGKCKISEPKSQPEISIWGGGAEESISNFWCWVQIC